MTFELFHYVTRAKVPQLDQTVHTCEVGRRGWRGSVHTSEVGRRGSVHTSEVGEGVCIQVRLERECAYK